MRHQVLADITQTFPEILKSQSYLNQRFLKETTVYSDFKGMLLEYLFHLTSITQQITPIDLQKSNRSRLIVEPSYFGYKFIDDNQEIGEIDSCFKSRGQIYVIEVKSTFKPSQINQIQKNTKLVKRILGTQKILPVVAAPIEERLLEEATNLAQKEQIILLRLGRRSHFNETTQSIYQQLHKNYSTLH